MGRRFFGINGAHEIPLLESRLRKAGMELSSSIVLKPKGELEDASVKTAANAVVAWLHSKGISVAVEKTRGLHGKGKFPRELGKRIKRKTRSRERKPGQKEKPRGQGNGGKGPFAKWKPKKIRMKPR